MDCGDDIGWLSAETTSASRIPTPSLQLDRTGSFGLDWPSRDSGQTAAQRYCVLLRGLPGKLMDIFEGTEQIHELVISRAISGLRIE
jgi:hypothetical protein